MSIGEKEEWARNAYRCFVLSTFAAHMLTTAKMLLDAGAKNIPLDDGETPLNATGSEQSFQDTCECNHHQGIFSRRFIKSCLHGLRGVPTMELTATNGLSEKRSSGS